MNGFLVAAAALLACLGPCAIASARGDALDRLAAAELATVIAVLALLLVAQGQRSPSSGDVAVTLAVLVLPGTLAFTHLLERAR